MPYRSLTTRGVWRTRRTAGFSDRYETWASGTWRLARADTPLFPGPPPMWKGSWEPGLGTARNTFDHMGHSSLSGYANLRSSYVCLPIFRAGLPAILLVRPVRDGTRSAQELTVNAGAQAVRLSPCGTP